MKKKTAIKIDDYTAECTPEYWAVITDDDDLNICKVCNGHGGWLDGDGPLAEPVQCPECSSVFIERLQAEISGYQALAADFEILKKKYQGAKEILKFYGDKPVIQPYQVGENIGYIARKFLREVGERG